MFCFGRKTTCWIIVKNYHVINKLKKIYCCYCLAKYELALQKSNYENCTQEFKLNPAIQLKLKYASNPDDYVIAVFQDSRISTNERFMALCNSTFLEIADEILQQFNQRTNSTYKRLRDIPVNKIVESDITIMNELVNCKK